MTSTTKLTVRALLGVVACALLLPLSAPAATRVAAATPCWKALLNDWYDGRIDKQYPIPCYRDAIKHLPTDILTYSSAREDIQRALQLAVARHESSVPPSPATTTTPAAVGATGTTGTTGPTGAKGRTKPTGPIPSAIGDSSSGGATSFPLPLIILGGLAIFLLAAGAVGLIVRRMQGRDSGTP